MPRSKKGSKRVDFSNFDFEAFEEAGKEYKETKQALEVDSELNRFDGPAPSKYLQEREPMGSDFECLYTKSANGDIFVADKKKDRESYNQALRNLHSCIFRGRHVLKLREYLRYLKISEKKYTEMVYDKARKNTLIMFKRTVTRGEREVVEDASRGLFDGEVIPYRELARALKQTFALLKDQYVAKKKSPWE